LVVWGLSKDKVSWITCPECGSKIGIVITVGKAEAKVEERLPTLGEGWPPGSAQQVLEAAGIDVSQLNHHPQKVPRRLVGPHKRQG